MRTGNRNFEVSVILTLFNSRKFYYRALSSVLEQSYVDIEIIIVDDGSTDSIETEIIPEIKDHDNIKYLRHSNRKQPLSLNSGIFISTGEYITFLDSDDEYKHDHIQERINFMHKNKYIDLLCSGAEFIGNEEDMFVPDASDINKMIHVNDCVMLGTLFGKRKVFFELDGFKDIYSHDSDFFNRAEKIFKTSRLDSKSYVYYRNNPDSVINKLKKVISTNKKFDYKR
ncbi:MAG: glycosyltransferase family 2 protein [Ignavibacteria bacterium]